MHYGLPSDYANGYEEPIDDDLNEFDSYPNYKP